MPSLGLMSEQIIVAPPRFLRFNGYNKENILFFLLFLKIETTFDNNGVSKVNIPLPVIT